MARKITAFGSSEAEVRHRIAMVASKYPNMSMTNFKLIGPATTPAGGTQYVAECILI